MKLVILSDTHSMHRQIAGGVPAGDVLVHAGDICGANNKPAVGSFLEWFAEQPHRHKVFIAGNHDGTFETDPHWCREAMQQIDPAMIYLQDSGCEIEGQEFWGSPWQPWFMDWHFNLQRGEALAKKWALIPDGTDVLITHGPPHGILDECPEFIPGRRRSEAKSVHVGCEELTKAVDRVRPKVHIFGHIHEGYGVLERDGTTFVNASNLTGDYDPLNPAIVFEL